MLLAQISYLLNCLYLGLALYLLLLTPFLLQCWRPKAFRLYPHFLQAIVCIPAFLFVFVLGEAHTSIECFLVTGSLNDWLPPSSLRSLTLISCDLHPLTCHVIPAPCADGDHEAVRESRDWAHITYLRFSSCLPQQIIQVISLFSSVTRLELSHSNVSDSDLTSLLPSLPPLLTAIDLSHNPLSSLPLRNLLLSTPLLQSLAFIGCRFLPSSLTSTAEAIRDHPNLCSIAMQVDGSASAVRLLQVPIALKIVLYPGF